MHRSAPAFATVLAVLLIAATSAAAAEPRSRQLDKRFGRGGVSQAVAINREVGQFHCFANRSGALYTIQTLHPYRLRISKLNTRGRLIRSFGKDGHARLAPSGGHVTSTTDRSGRLVIVTLEKADGRANPYFRVQRLTNRGKLDRQFGERGFADLDRETPDVKGVRVKALTGLSNGNLAIAVGSGVANRIVVLRPNGTLDAAFGGTGFLTPDYEPTSIAPGVGGRLLIAGRGGNGQAHVILEQLEPDASRVSTWGTGGRFESLALPGWLEQQLRYGPSDVRPVEYSLVDVRAVMLADGSAMVAIQSELFPAVDQPDAIVWMAKLNKGGALDLQYGRSGLGFARVFRDPFDAHDGGAAVRFNYELTSDGSVVAAGFWYDQGYSWDARVAVKGTSRRRNLGVQRFDLSSFTYDARNSRVLVCGYTNDREYILGLKP